VLPLLRTEDNEMLKVKDIMTTEVFVLHATQTLELVRSLMRIKHVRHVPIVDADNVFVGLMTHRDLLAQTISHLAEIDEEEQEYLDRHIHIVNIMKTDVVTADPEMDICSAISLLLDHKYGCLPVVSNGKLVGIVTEADFLNLTLGLLRKSDSTCV
jgi:CBS domain-containing membrane protein